LLYILNELFSEVITTHEIAKEFGMRLPAWVQIKKVKNSLLQKEFENYVDIGEASAIALASENKFDYLVLDDAEAKKFAQKLGFPIKGTFGILLIAKQRGVVSLLRPYIDWIITHTNFRISKTVVNQILKDAGEM